MPQPIRANVTYSKTNKSKYKSITSDKRLNQFRNLEPVTRTNVVQKRRFRKYLFLLTERTNYVKLDVRRNSLSR